MTAPAGRNGALAEIAAILAAGYLRLQADRAKSQSEAKLRPRDSALSPCYGARPEA